MNDYDISNEELVMLAREMNEDAIELLEKRFLKLIDYLLRKYEDKITYLKIDKLDLKADCIEKYLLAFDTYCPLSNASFLTYTYLIIERGIKRYLRKYERKMLDLCELDIDWVYSEKNNVEKDVIVKINKEHMMKYIKYKLKGIEKQICFMLVKGYNCVEISKELKINYKTCYQKIKKVRNILEKEFKILEIYR